MLTGTKQITASDFTNGIQIDTNSFQTNMHFKKTNTPSKFLMHGPKFFDELRIYLLKNNELGEYAL
ncbi:hypothetical protein COK81_04625, partial [Bacillus thuringiensis]